MELGLPHLLKHLAIHLQLLCLLVRGDGRDLPTTPPRGPDRPDPKALSGISSSTFINDHPLQTLKEGTPSLLAGLVSTTPAVLCPYMQEPPHLALQVSAVVDRCLSGKGRSYPSWGSSQNLRGTHPLV